MLIHEHSSYVAIIYNKGTGLPAKGKKRMFCNYIARN